MNKKKLNILIHKFIRLRTAGFMIEYNEAHERPEGQNFMFPNLEVAFGKCLLWYLGDEWLLHVTEDIKEAIAMTLDLTPEQTNELYDVYNRELKDCHISRYGTGVFVAVVLSKFKYYVGYS